MNTNREKNDKLIRYLIGYVSVIVPLLVAAILFFRKGDPSPSEAIQFLPTLNAIINSTVTVFLIIGFIMIRQGKRNTHRTFMLSSLILSVVFLLSYLIYHSKAHHVEFQGEGAIKFVYLFILLSHILLSVAVVPLALISVYRGLASKFAAHRKIARWTFPIWLYVSVTGVLVYYFAHVYNVA